MNSTGSMAGRAKVIPMNRGYEPSRVVHLRNLPEDIDMDDVMELGRPFGPVISALRIKETQAFLYMQELKDAEELVNEYRQHPPKIGWRTVFVQFSQYTRLDVGARKPDSQGRSRQSTTSSERHVRDRSRERRRSSSPDSPPSPPLPDISVPFYMLPRPEEPELSIPATSRPQLVCYPHLANSARVPLISYPTPQAHDNTVAASHNLANSLAPSHTAMSNSGLPTIATSHVQPHQLPSYQPPASHVLYDERSSQPTRYNNSTVHSIENHQQLQPQQQSVAGQSDQPESGGLNCLHSVIERIAADVQVSRHKAINDLLSCVNDVDMALVDMMRHEFGERSLPATVSTILALRRLDINTLSSLAYLDSPSVNSVSRQHSFAGIDDFAALFLRVAQTVCDSGEQTAAKRRRYDDDDDINNLSSSSEMHLHQNQTWNSAADYHKHLQL